MHVSTCADRGSNPCHDERNGEEGDDGTACRQCDGECHIASCQHGEHIARTTARTAGNEHDAQEKERVEVKNGTYSPSNKGQQDNLSDHSCQHGQGTLQNQLEIVWTQCKTEVKHQQRQNGKNNKYGVHLVI